MRWGEENRRRGLYCAVRNSSDSPDPTAQSGGRVRGGAAAHPSRKGPWGGPSGCCLNCKREGLPRELRGPATCSLSSGPLSNEGVEAGNQGSDILVEGALPFKKGTLPSKKVTLPLNEGTLPFDQDTLTLGHGAEDLLDFQVLLADANVKLREPFLLDPIIFPEQSDHLLAVFAGRHVPEARDERRLHIRKAPVHFALQVGEATVNVFV